MDMQDKEFDELFRSKLGELEVQPTMHVWDNISHELNSGKRKRALYPFLSVAASIAVLITAGIVFIPQKAKLNSGHPVQNKLVRRVIVQKEVKGDGKDHLVTKKSNGAVVYVNNVASSQPVNVHSKETIKSKSVIGDTLNKRPNDDQLLTASPEKVRIETKTKIPDEAMQLVDNEQLKNTLVDANTTAQEAVSNKHKTAPVRKRNRIRSFGDLMNVMIAKVDKRQDKFIQFSNTDDDESTITGVNLGIIKIKKEDK